MDEYIKNAAHGKCIPIGLPRAYKHHDACRFQMEEANGNGTRFLNVAAMLHSCQQITMLATSTMAFQCHDTTPAWNEPQNH